MFNFSVFPFSSKTNALNISQKMVEMFVRTKHKIDKRHEFALVIINDDALWVSANAFYLQIRLGIMGQFYLEIALILLLILVY